MGIALSIYAAVVGTFALVVSVVAIYKSAIVKGTVDVFLTETKAENSPDAWRHKTL